MAASEADSAKHASRAKALAAHPEAAHWAKVCAWVPGTGYCRDRDCGEACLFHAQRQADAQRVRRWRRRRRISILRV